MNEMNDIMYFTSKDLNDHLIKDLIRLQGNETCRDEIDMLYIRNVINDYDFGYLRITEKANIGKKHSRRSGDKYYVWGFVLCKISENQKIATIELVCARQLVKGMGKLLIEKVIDKLKNNGTTKLVRLWCLPKDKLRKFYIGLGFAEQQLNIPQPTMKLIEMVKWMDE